MDYFSISIAFDQLENVLEIFALAECAEKIEQETVSVCRFLQETTTAGSFETTNALLGSFWVRLLLCKENTR